MQEADSRRRRQAVNNVLTELESTMRRAQAAGLQVWVTTPDGAVARDFDINVGSPAAVEPEPVADAAAGPRQAGYTGNSCKQCGSVRMRRNGPCEICDECGGTSACS
jgi:hypothetical protein